MLTVRDDGDPGVEQLEHVLPPLLVAARARHVGVRQLVDEGDLGPAGEHGVEVHLLELAARGTRPPCGARPRGPG